MKPMLNVGLGILMNGKPFIQNSACAFFIEFPREGKWKNL